MRLVAGRAVIATSGTTSFADIAFLSRFILSRMLVDKPRAVPQREVFSGPILDSRIKRSVTDVNGTGCRYDPPDVIGMSIP